jgi:hypothetical protein
MPRRTHSTKPWHGPWPWQATFGVEVVSRQTADTIFYFLLNLTEEDHQISLPRAMKDMLGDRNEISQIQLGGLEAAVLSCSVSSGQ